MSCKADLLTQLPRTHTHQERSHRCFSSRKEVMVMCSEWKVTDYTHTRTHLILIPYIQERQSLYSIVTQLPLTHTVTVE